MCDVDRAGTKGCNKPCCEKTPDRVTLANQSMMSRKSWFRRFVWFVEDFEQQDRLDVQYLVRNLM